MTILYCVRQGASSVQPVIVSGGRAAQCFHLNDICIQIVASICFLFFLVCFFLLKLLSLFELPLLRKAASVTKRKNPSCRNATRGCGGNIGIKKVSPSVGFVHKRRALVPVTLRRTITTTASTFFGKVSR